MKRLALAALVFGVGLAGPAVAQYYGAPPQPGYGYDAPPPGYRPPPPAGYGQGYGGGGYGGGQGYDGGRRGYDQDPDQGYGRRGGGGYRGAQGSVCITSRGTCPIGYQVPKGSPCRCDIPGFGQKRGASS